MRKKIKVMHFGEGEWEVRQYSDTEVPGIEVYFHRNGKWFAHATVKREITYKDIPKFLKAFKVEGW